jgi:hypothetical protein
MRPHPTSMPSGVLAALVIGLVLIIGVDPVRAQSTETDTNVTNEYRLTLFPHYPIAGPVSGFGYMGYVKNPELDYALWYGGFPGVIYTIKPWLQAWSALLLIYTDNYTAVNGKQDSLELRPFVGGKIFLPNTLKWNIYNFTRLEFREVYHHDTHRWTSTQRLRMRFGVEIPLTSRARAWKPGTLYLVANTEPMYRFDNDVIDPARAQVGIGWVTNSRFRPEFLYYANWGRVGPNNSLAYNENIFRLNIKIGLEGALLGNIWNPGHDR